MGFIHWLTSLVATFFNNMSSFDPLMISRFPLRGGNFRALSGLVSALPLRWNSIPCNTRGAVLISNSQHSSFSLSSHLVCVTVLFLCTDTSPGQWWSSYCLEWALERLPSDHLQDPVCRCGDYYLSLTKQLIQNTDRQEKQCGLLETEEFLSHRWTICRVNN